MMAIHFMDVSERLKCLAQGLGTGFARAMREGFPIKAVTVKVQFGLFGEIIPP